MKELIEQQRAGGFPALAGSEVTVRLPVQEHVLNEIIRATVLRKGSSGTLRNLVVSFQSRNQLSILAEIDKWPLPKSIRIGAVLAPRIDFLRDPRLLIILESSFLIGLAIKAVVSFVGSLQSFVTQSGDNLFVDIKALLIKLGAEEYLPYIRDIEFQSGPHVLYVVLHLKISEQLT